MNTRFTFWKDSEGGYLGYLNSHPDHWTQGKTLQDLKEHLRDLHEIFTADEIPGIRREEDLAILIAKRGRKY